MEFKFLAITKVKNCLGKYKWTSLPRGPKCLLKINFASFNMVALSQGNISFRALMISVSVIISRKRIRNNSPVIQTESGCKMQERLPEDHDFFEVSVVEQHDCG